MTRQDEIRELIREYQRNLHHKKLQQARYGIDTPSHILVEIEDIETEIGRLQEKLEALQHASPEPAESAAPPLTAPKPAQPESPSLKTAVDVSNFISEPDLAQLQKAVSEQNLVLFVGPGFSELAGLPAWYDLMSDLSGQIDYDLPPLKWATADALLDAAQAYINRQGLNDLIRFLMEKLDTGNVSPTPAHRALAQLPVSLIFTANYDDLLKETFEGAGKRVNIVTRDSYIPFMGQGENEVNIIKLYGDLRQPDTLVLARQQVEAYWGERPQTIKLLETELARATAFYIGWSHSDPFFSLLLGQLLDRLQEFGRRGYAALFNLTKSQAKDLETRKKIRLLPFSPEQSKVTQLAALFEVLSK